ncbi:MAG: hypothetical protein ACQGVC_02890 [Myxococcota bacterium]
MRATLVSIAVAAMACAGLANDAAEPAATRQLDAHERRVLLSACETRWPDDYRMQEQCLEVQGQGFLAVRAFIEEHEINDDSTSPAARILATCAAKWDLGDGQPDWRMIAACVDRQLPAYRRLHPDG